MKKGDKKLHLHAKFAQSKKITMYYIIVFEPLFLYKYKNVF